MIPTLRINLGFFRLFSNKNQPITSSKTPINRPLKPENIGDSFPIAIICFCFVSVAPGAVDFASQNAHVRDGELPVLNWPNARLF
jgi:hypothetical protein